MAERVLGELIDRVLEACESDRNKARGQTRPSITVGMEEPIAWTVLWGLDGNRYFSDPEYYLAHSLRAKLWRFENVEDDSPIGPDVPAWLGHYPEYTFFGMDVSFNRKGVPILQRDHPMTRDPDMGLLSPVDFDTSGWMPRARKWHEDLMALCEGRLPVHFIGWNRGCLDLAIQLRGYENFVLDTVERPEFTHDLLRFLTDQRNAWYSAYVERFGTKLGPTWINDDWIYVPYITPRMFEEFLLPRYLDMERHHGVVGGVHSCGNQAPIQRYLLEIKTLSTFEVSPWTDLEQTVANVPAEKHLHIFVHPNDVLVASDLDMASRFRCIRELCDGRSYSVGTSGLTPIFEGDQEGELLRRIRRWLRLAHRILRG